MRKTVIVGSIFAFLMGAAVVAYARARQDFTIINKIGDPIDQFYVSPNDANNWGEDILGQDVLQNGQRCNIHMKGYDSDDCTFDVRIVESDGDAWVVENLDLCRISKVVFKKKGGSVIWEAE